MSIQPSLHKETDLPPIHPSPTATIPTFVKSQRDSFADQENPWLKTEQSSRYTDFPDKSPLHWSNVSVKHSQDTEKFREFDELQPVHRTNTANRS